MATSNSNRGGNYGNSPGEGGGKFGGSGLGGSAGPGRGSSPGGKTSSSSKAGGGGTSSGSWSGASKSSAPSSKSTSSTSKGGRVGANAAGAGPGRGVSAGGPTSAAGRAAASSGARTGGNTGNYGNYSGAGAGRGATAGGPTSAAGRAAAASGARTSTGGTGTVGAGRGLSPGGPTSPSGRAAAASGGSGGIKGGDVGRYSHATTGSIGLGFEGTPATRYSGVPMSAGPGRSLTAGGPMTASERTDATIASRMAGTTVPVTGTQDRLTGKTSRIGGLGTAGLDPAIVAGMAAENYRTQAFNDLMSQRRQLENTTMDAYTRAVQSTTENARRAEFAEQAREIENKTMDVYNDTLANARVSQAMGDVVTPYNTTSLYTHGPVTPPDVPLSEMKEQGVPDLAAAPKAIWSQPAGFNPPKSDVVSRVLASWAAELGPENVRITATPHGGLRTSKKGSRSGRHGPTTGDALDYSVEVLGPEGWRSLDFGNPQDKALADRVAVRGARDFGLKGYGAGNGYMSNRAIHHDVQSQPKSGGFTWTGPEASVRNVPQSLQNSLAQARSDYDAAKKTTAPTGQLSVASMMASPSEETSQMAALNRASATTTTARETTAPAPARAAPTPESKPDAMTTRSLPADNLPTVNLPQRAPKPTSREAAPYQRSLAGWGKAIGVDLLTSASGPVGLVANIVSLLATGETIGGAVADASGGRWGENYYNPGGPQSPGTMPGGAGGYKEGGRSSEQRMAAEAAGRQNEPTTVPETAQTPVPSTFEEKYIEFSDPTVRPDPEQKWDWKSPRYIGVA